MLPSACPDGFYFDDSLLECLSCGFDSGDVSQLVTLIVVAALFFLLVAALVALVGDWRLGCTVGWIVFVQQLVSIVQTAGHALLTGEDGFSHFIQKIIRLLSIVNFDVVLVKPGCQTPRLSFPAVFFGTLLFFLFVLALFIGASAIYARYRVSSAFMAARGWSRWDAWHERAQHAAFIFGYMVYLQACTRIFQGILCHERDGRSVLLADPTTECWQGAHKFVGVLCWVLLFVYAIGWPLYCQSVLRRMWLPRLDNIFRNPHLASRAVRAASKRQKAMEKERKRRLKAKQRAQEEQLRMQQMARQQIEEERIRVQQQEQEDAQLAVINIPSDLSPIPSAAASASPAVSASPPVPPPSRPLLVVSAPPSRTESPPVRLTATPTPSPTPSITPLVASTAAPSHSLFPPSSLAPRDVAPRVPEERPLVTASPLQEEEPNPFDSPLPPLSAAPSAALSSSPAVPGTASDNPFESPIVTTVAVSAPPARSPAPPTRSAASRHARSFSEEILFDDATRFSGVVGNYRRSAFTPSIYYDGFDRLYYLYRGTRMTTYWFRNCDCATNFMLALTKSLSTNTALGLFFQALVFLLYFLIAGVLRPYRSTFENFTAMLRGSMNGAQSLFYLLLLTGAAAREGAFTNVGLFFIDFALGLVFLALVLIARRPELRHLRARVMPFLSPYFLSEEEELLINRGGVLPGWRRVLDIMHPEAASARRKASAAAVAAAVAQSPAAAAALDGQAIEPGVSSDAAVEFALAGEVDSGGDAWEGDSIPQTKPLSMSDLGLERLPESLTRPLEALARPLEALARPLERPLQLLGLVRTPRQLPPLDLDLASDPLDSDPDEGVEMDDLSARRRPPSLSGAGAAIRPIDFGDDDNPFETPADVDANASRSPSSPQPSDDEGELHESSAASAHQQLAHDGSGAHTRSPTRAPAFHPSLSASSAVSPLSTDDTQLIERPRSPSRM